MEIYKITRVRRFNAILTKQNLVLLCNYKITDREKEPQTEAASGELNMKIDRKKVDPVDENWREGRDSHEG